MQYQHRGVPMARFAPVALLAFVACGGPSPSSAGSSVASGRLALSSVKLGRLVDVYAYERIDRTHGDRRDRFNRRFQLVARDVVVNPNIETESLFDAGGDEVPTADYEFRPFDIATGHEELLILWDDTVAEETLKFKAALAAAQTGLGELAPSFRNQNIATRPIPVVPRNAALVLSFSGPVNVDEQFFAITPSAVQVLEFRGDPNVVPAVDAFRAVPFRVIPRGNTIIVDPTIIGGENRNGLGSAGLPISVDNTTANIRLAIPSRGGAAPSFFVDTDPVAELNSVDSFGRNSVIRDFRSGNHNDGTAGTLRDLEAPMIVGSVPMGVTAVDTTNKVVTLNRRLHNVPVRARYPFVEGTLSPVTGLPLGPAAVPTVTPLRAGDFLVQNVEVPMPDGRIETVRVRAEVLQNMDVGTIRNDPNFPGPGLAIDGSQRESAIDFPTVRVRLATLSPAVDSAGRPVAFTASSLPEGADCTMRVYYYERVRYLVGGQVVSDSAHRQEFLHVDPAPPAEPTSTTVGVPNVDPVVSVAVEFSEPLDIARIDKTTNLVLASASLPASLPTGEDFATLIADAKLATGGVVATRLADQAGDGTLWQLQPPDGLFHLSGQQETYWFHVLLGSNGLVDFGGNPIALFSDPSQPVRNWSISLGLASGAENNLVGWHVYRFEDIDEDGTLPGSIDIFGQYRLADGKLTAAETVRFSRTADAHNLAGISRILRGECWDQVNDMQLFPTNPPNGGVLYWQPRMVDTVAPPNVPPPYPFFQTLNQPVGHVIEPHQPRGSRMMMRYLEDDFDLSYRQPTDYMLDIEQLYWSPFNDDTVLFDVFDRYTMSLAHADRRPDIHFSVQQGAMGPICNWDCPSASSSLSTTFLENPLQGTIETNVFEDKVYTINPNAAFRSPLNVKYVPYPKFDHSYTWRDSRLVTVNNGQVVGLTGAREPQAPTPNDDFTANIDSPWVPSVPLPANPVPGQPPRFILNGGTTWVMDEGDFLGDRKRDHDPIAAPLLVDFKVFPDSAANGIARGTNGFQMAMLGPPSDFLITLTPGGYYNFVGVGCANRDPWPRTRVHTTGGLDPNTNADILVDPANTLLAIGGWIKDSGTIILIQAGAAGSPTQAIFQAPPGDGMINWAQADFVRRVSSMTFGFLDTLQPNRRQSSATSGTAGFPEFITNAGTIGDVRILDMITQMDPPQSLQPAGTSVVAEFRGATSFDNSNTLYNPSANDTVAGRGNLLNANYACEAYRYSQPNSSPTFDQPRVHATALTAYVNEDRLSTIREATGLLPRFINMRLVMTNNVSVSPAVSPSLKSLSLIYRMQRINN